MIKYIVPIIVIICCFVIYFLASIKVCLTGMYVNDPDSEFTKKSKIKMMMLYIGDPSRGITGTKYKCHLLIDDKFNDYLYITGPLIQTSHYKISGSFKVKCDESECPWQKHVKLQYNLLNGKLTITGIDESGEKITYAKLYRDNVLSI